MYLLLCILEDYEKNHLMLFHRILIVSKSWYVAGWVGWLVRLMCLGLLVGVMYLLVGQSVNWKWMKKKLVTIVCSSVGLSYFWVGDWLGCLPVVYSGELERYCDISNKLRNSSNQETFGNNKDFWSSDKFFNASFLFVYLVHSWVNY